VEGKTLQTGGPNRLSAGCAYCFLELSLLLDDPDGLLLEPLGEAEELLPLEDVSLEEELGLELEPLELGGVLLEELLELGELELGLDGLVLDEPEPDMEPELDGELLEPDEEAEPEGDDGEELLDDAPFEAPPLLLPPRSQPYRPPTATAIGRRTNADFLSKLILGLLSIGRLGCSPLSASTAPADDVYKSYPVHR
jgi:hypothetical protein